MMRLAPLLCLALLATVSLSQAHAQQAQVVPFITQQGLSTKPSAGPSSSWVRAGGGGSAVLVLSEFDGRSYRLTGMVQGNLPSDAPMAMLDLRLHGQSSATWATTDSPCRLQVQVLKGALQVSGSSADCVGPNHMSYDGYYIREK